LFSKSSSTGQVAYNSKGIHGVMLNKTSQEDAMEFMTYLLDALHEEMVGADVEGEQLAAEEVKDDSGWATVSKSAKVKSVVDDNSREQAARENASTVISRVFHGTLR
jgi:ubiquitin C-terminal hydrolase